MLQPDAAHRPEVRQSGDVGGRLTSTEQPSDVGEPGATGDRVGVTRAVGVGVMRSMVGAPRQGRVLERRCSEGEHGPPDGGRGAVRAVREETVIAAATDSPHATYNDAANASCRHRWMDDDPAHTDGACGVDQHQPGDCRPAQRSCRGGGTPLSSGSPAMWPIWLGRSSRVSGVELRHPPDPGRSTRSCRGH